MVEMVRIRNLFYLFSIIVSQRTNIWRGFFVHCRRIEHVFKFNELVAQSAQNGVVFLANRED